MRVRKVSKNARVSLGINDTQKFVELPGDTQFALFGRDHRRPLSITRDIFPTMSLPEILSDLKIGLNVPCRRRYAQNAQVGVAFAYKLPGTPYATFSSIID